MASSDPPKSVKGSKVSSTFLDPLLAHHGPDTKLRERARAADYFDVCEEGEIHENEADEDNTCPKSGTVHMSDNSSLTTAPTPQSHMVKQEVDAEARNALHLLADEHSDHRTATEDSERISEVQRRIMELIGGNLTTNVSSTQQQVTRQASIQQSRNGHRYAPAPKNKPMNSSPDKSFQTPYLLESMGAGKIRLFLNGTTQLCTHGRLLYKSGKNRQNLTEIGYENTSLGTAVFPGSGDLILERSASNYKILTEGYYHLKFRKEELRVEWLRQNTERMHLLALHPYEVDNEGDNPPREACKSSDQLTGFLPDFRHQGPSGYTEGRAVQRPLMFLRGSPAEGNPSCWHRTDTMGINVATGILNTNKHKRHHRAAFTLPETEEMYARLAWFVRRVKLEDWMREKEQDTTTPQVADARKQEVGLQPTSATNPKKRGLQETSQPFKPSKKAKQTR